MTDIVNDASDNATEDSWKQITIITTTERVDEVSDVLESLGACAITYMDAKDDPILEPLPGEQRLWPNTQVIGLFHNDEDIDLKVSYLQHNFGDNMPIASHELESRDWVRAWMENFKPIQCGSKLWICPTWAKVEDPNAITVMLDPGLAFGTGTHPTTFLCLGFLDRIENLKDLEVLDYGCGSGILAIAALKLGAKHAYGVDIDPQALIASKDNAERNEVGNRISLFDGNDKRLQACPVVVANILAGPLAELEPNIAALCTKGGRLALSGILETQLEEVVEAYEQDFNIDNVTVLDSWALIEATRK